MSDEREVDRQEAEKILGKASSITTQSEGKLTIGELKVAGAEVGLTGGSIDAAIAAQRLEAEQAAIRKLRRKAVMYRMAAGFFLCVGCAFGLSAWNGFSLGIDKEKVELTRARVQEALARQERVRQTFVGHEPDSRMDAELMGSQNRVSIAMRRYDAAAAEYNRDSRCWMVGRSYITYPVRYPFSQEVTRW